MRDQYIKSGDGFLLVYSITDHSSSHSVTAFQEQIIAVRGEKDKIIPQIPLVLVGNKVRLNHFFFYDCFCQIIAAKEPKKGNFTTNSHSLDWKHSEAYFLFLVCLLLSISAVGGLSFCYPFRVEKGEEIFNEG